MHTCCSLVGWIHRLSVLLIEGNTCSKHLDFPASLPLSSLDLCSLYWRHDSRDTHLKISFCLKAWGGELLCKTCLWNLSVVPPSVNRDAESSNYFQCNAILWFCSVPCDLTSAIIVVCFNGWYRKQISQAEKPLRWHAHFHTLLPMSTRFCRCHSL